jgi:stress response protein SCP2
MTTKAEEIDVFDRAYRDRVREAVWEAIIEASRDPMTSIAPLRNYEIYDALLQLQAMILASSKQANSPTKMRAIGDQFAKRLRRLVAEFKRTYDRDGGALCCDSHR